MVEKQTGKKEEMRKYLLWNNVANSALFLYFLKVIEVEMFYVRCFNLERSKFSIYFRL